MTDANDAAPVSGRSSIPTETGNRTYTVTVTPDRDAAVRHQDDDGQRRRRRGGYGPDIVLDRCASQLSGGVLDPTASRCAT